MTVGAPAPYAVLKVAAHKGEPSPTRAVLVPTTRRLAELVDVDTAVRDAPVYFVLGAVPDLSSM